MVRGDIECSEPVLVRMHAHCLVGNVFGSEGCDCRDTLDGSLAMIASEGRGALIYLHQSSKGFAVERVGDKTAIYFHHDRTPQTVSETQRKTQREIGIGAQILSDLNLHRIRLLTNHPRRVAALEGFDIEIVDQVPVSLARKIQ
jgi:3,4-dihydroxy 2-butanone 4-phosphate synthase/GTP cyclohydrolase II